MTRALMLEGTTGAFDTKAFRQALGTFPTGVAIITTRDSEGRPIGITCNSFSSVSLEPPLVLWSLRTASKNLSAFRACNGFAINVLADDQSELSARFASSSIADKFCGVDYWLSAEGLPLIGGSIARFHCETFAEHEAGDHVIFIGHVTQFEHAREDDPLVFYKGAYMMLAQSLREWAADGRISTEALVEARVSIYRLLLGFACERADPSDLDAIEDHLKKMEGMTGRGDMADRAHAALDFFALITRSAHNDVLAIVSKSLSTLMLHAVNAQGTVMTWPALHQPELTPIRWAILASLRQRNHEAAVVALNEYFAHVLRFQSQIKR